MPGTRRRLLTWMMALTVIGGTAGERQAGLPFGSALYEAVRMFGLGGAHEPGSATSLDVFRWAARFVAPMLTAAWLLEAAELAGLLSVAGLSFQLLGWIPRWPRPIVVVGVGRLGQLLCRRLVHGLNPVIAIEHSKDNPYLYGLRALGVIVVVGDGRDPAVRALARMRKARAVFAVTEFDLVNIEVGLHARADSQEPGGHGDMQICVQVYDDAVRDALPRAIGTSGGPQVKLFNSFHCAAARLVSDIQPKPGEATLPTLYVVAGLGRFGGAVLDELSRRYGGNPTVTVLVVDPTLSVEAVRKDARWALLTDPQLDPRPMDMLEPGLLADIATIAGQRSVRFLICTDRDEKNLQFALAVSKAFGVAGANVSVTMRVFESRRILEVARFSNITAYEVMQPFREPPPAEPMSWPSRRAFYARRFGRRVFHLARQLSSPDPIPNEALDALLQIAVAPENPR